MILAASVMAAADVENGDHAAGIFVFTATTLLVFWLAHVYSGLLGDWADKGQSPDGASIVRSLKFEFPIFSAPMLPISILFLGWLDVISDHESINAALGLCVAELGLTAWFASRRGGASLVWATLAVLVSLSFGVGIIALKSILHG